jgi:uncharacterized protein (TIGR02271 family)
VNERGQRLRLPYTEEKVKDAPAFDSDSDISDAEEAEIYRYYGMAHGNRSAQRTAGTGVATGTTPAGAGMASTGTAPTTRTQERSQARGPGREEATLQLSEEQLNIGKREVEAGGVRLRKVVRTEVVNRPVELRREEIVVERVPANQTTATPGAGSFQEQEIYIPLRREEAVVQKEVRVREEVRARKESQTETQQVSGQVRREDVDVERTGEARERGPKKDRKV